KSPAPEPVEPGRRTTTGGSRDCARCCSHISPPGATWPRCWRSNGSNRLDPGSPGPRLWASCPPRRRPGFPPRGPAPPPHVRPAPWGHIRRRRNTPPPPGHPPPRLLALGAPEPPNPARGGPAPAPPDHGVAILAIEPHGNADLFGLKPGDVLLEYNSQVLRTI